MIRLFSFLSFLGTSLAQFRPPVITLAPPPTIPVFTIGSIAPIRTIGTTIQNITSSFSTQSTPSTLSPTSTLSTQTDEPENNEEINQNLFLLIIPGSLLLLFFSYLCIRKKRHVNVVNIDLNIENKIPTQEPTRKASNLSNHFYEEINYEARYEMPDIQNVKYENVIEENEYGKQVTTIV